MSQWTLNWIVIIATSAILLITHPSRSVLIAGIAICAIMAIRQRMR